MSQIMAWPAAVQPAAVGWSAGGLYRRPGTEGQLAGDIYYRPGELDDLLRSEAERNLAALLAAQRQQAATRTGRDNTSTTDSSVLTQAMAAMVVGQRIPVVFGRRREGGTGGVLVQPRATEVQISNSSDRLTVRWHCVLGDGPMASVQVRDVRNGLYRQGVFSQNYNRRAGTWAPGNRTRALPGAELPADLPLQCGVGGAYDGISTIEFSNSYPIDSDRWRQAWSVFCRGGLIIERGRLVDGVVGPSDNLCDLAIWALVRSGRLTEEQIDMDAMEAAALFLEVNGLHCNAEFAEAASIPDWLTGLLPLFLLRETTIGGRFALVPVLPVNDDGTLQANRIIPDLTITEEALVPGAWSEQLPAASERGPLRFACSYRQQTDDTEPPLVVSMSVGDPEDQIPTVEEFPMAGVVTSRLHVATAAGYRHAMRTVGGQTATATLRASSVTGFLRAGQVVRVVLRLAAEQEQGWIDGCWIITRADIDGDSNETLQLVGLPLDADGRSIISRQVLAARELAGNVVYPYPVISGGDEPGREADTSVPPSTTSGEPFRDGGSGRGGSGGDGGSGDVNMPPADPPADPPGGGEIPDGAGGAVGGGGPEEPEYGGTIKLPSRYVAGVSITSGRNPCKATEIHIERAKQYYVIDGEQVYSGVQYGPSWGTIDTEIIEEIPDQMTIYGPEPMTIVRQGIYFQPAIQVPGGGYQPSGSRELQATIQTYVGVYHDGSIHEADVVRSYQSFCYTPGSSA